MEHLDAQLRPATSRGSLCPRLPVNGHLPALVVSLCVHGFLPLTFAVGFGGGP